MLDNINVKQKTSLPKGNLFIPNKNNFSLGWTKNKVALIYPEQLYAPLPKFDKGTYIPNAYSDTYRIRVYTPENSDFTREFEDNFKKLIVNVSEQLGVSEELLYQNLDHLPFRKVKEDKYIFKDGESIPNPRYREFLNNQVEFTLKCSTDKYTCLINNGNNVQKLTPSEIERIVGGKCGWYVVVAYTLLFYKTEVSCGVKMNLQAVQLLGVCKELESTAETVNLDFAKDISRTADFELLNKLNSTPTINGFPGVSSDQQVEYQKITNDEDNELSPFQSFVFDKIN